MIEEAILKVAGGKLRVTYEPDPVAPAPEPEPETAPEPTPEAEPEPNPIATPSEVQGMAWNDTEKTWDSFPGWESKLTALRFNVSDRLAWGKTLVFEFDRYTDYVKSGNLKWIRLWSDQYPNMYIGQPYEGWRILYVEDLPTSAGRRSVGGYTPPVSGKWRTERYELTMNSAPGIPDGSLRVFLDGVEAVAVGDFAFNSLSRPDLLKTLYIQDDPSNHTPKAEIGPIPVVRYRNVKLGSK